MSDDRIGSFVRWASIDEAARNEGMEARSASPTWYADMLTHCGRAVKSGLLESRVVMRNNRPEVEWRLTPKGVARYDQLKAAGTI